MNVLITFALLTHRECRTVVSYRAGLGDGTEAAICSDRACRCPPSDSDDRSKPSQRRMVSLYRAILSLVKIKTVRRFAALLALAFSRTNSLRTFLAIVLNFDFVRSAKFALLIFVSSTIARSLRFVRERQHNRHIYITPRIRERIVRFWLSAYAHVFDISLMH